MSNALESPLEALAINYLSFGFLTAVNSIWTWVAVIAGGISFLFTIRNPVKPQTDPVQPDPKPHDPVHTTCLPATSQSPEKNPTSFPSEAASVGSAVTKLEIVSKMCRFFPSEVATMGPAVTKLEIINERCRNTSKENITTASENTRRKFTVYFEDDDVADVRKDDDMDVCHVAERERGRGWELEGMMRMRILTGEEMGWYRYQDLTAIDGNVVRLWDGGVSTSSNFVPVTW